MIVMKPVCYNKNQPLGHEHAWPLLVHLTFKMIICVWVCAGTLPRRIRKELLTVKLRNRPSKQELEDRNIFPVRSDQERQEIRQQIEMKLAK